MNRNSIISIIFLIVNTIDISVLITYARCLSVTEYDMRSSLLTASKSKLGANEMIYFITPMPATRTFAQKSEVDPDTVFGAAALALDVFIQIFCSQLLFTLVISCVY